MPKPSSDVPTSSMPAASQAVRTHIREWALVEETPSLASIRLIVLTLIPARQPKSWTVKRSACRAERICEPVCMDLLSSESK